MKFEDLGLSDPVLRAIAEAGYTEPTPIQAKAIPVALMGRDILGIAQTGTGKTAGFALPIIEILSEGRARARMPRALVLAPTRELAAQVAENFSTYSRHTRLTMALLIGGVSMDEQKEKLERGVDVLIATPGRLLDLFERFGILLADTKTLVIDEADRMLDMGFIPDVERIVALLPKIRQTLFFSATMPPEVRRLADEMLINPKEISVAPPATTAENVEQHLAIVGPRDKGKAIRALIKGESVENAIIFCNRKRDVDEVFKSLQRDGYDVARLHGDLDQGTRTETLAKFKQGQVRLLVASDVAARGLDVIGLSHVFIFDPPFNPDDYVHRIGRTGRAGKNGRAFMLATPDDAKYIAAIEERIGKTIPRVEPEGIHTAELGEVEERGGRGRRGRGGARNRGDGDRDHDRKSETSADSPAKAADEQAEDDSDKTAAVDSGGQDTGPETADKPKRKRSRGGRGRRRKKSAEAGDRNENRPAKSGDGKSGGKSGNGSTPEEHLPAFLLRPARTE
jgi:superfamily II DNA/RNA helicase